MDELKNKVDEFEKKLIIEALIGAKSVNQAAKKLGCKRTTLVMKMKKYDLKIEK